MDKLKIGDGETILVENKGQHKRDFCDFQLLSSLIVQINRKPSSFKGAFNFSTTTPITLAMLIEALNAKKVVAFRPFENKPLNNFLSTTKIEKVLSQFSDHTLLAKLDFLK